MRQASPDYQASRLAVEALEKLPAETVLPALEAAVISEDHGIRPWAAFALARRGEGLELAILELGNVLKTHPTDYMRSNAATSLGNLGNAAVSAISALEFARDKDMARSVQQAVIKALREIRAPGEIIDAHEITGDPAPTNSSKPGYQSPYGAYRNPETDALGAYQAVGRSPGLGRSPNPRP